MNQKLLVLGIVTLTGIFYSIHQNISIKQKPDSWPGLQACALWISNDSRAIANQLDVFWPTAHKLWEYTDNVPGQIDQCIQTIQPHCVNPLYTAKTYADNLRDLLLKRKKDEYRNSLWQIESLTGSAGYCWF